MAKEIIRLGTRGSLLAKMQSQMIAGELEKQHPGVTVELVIIRTSGDRIQDRPLYEDGGKGLFTKELEQALIGSEVDFAVHSFKDVPVTMPLVDVSELVFAAAPPREDACDVLVTLKGKSIADLPTGAKVGTSSLRRQAQILALRSDLKVEPIRGNIDTRIGKLKAGEFDATILAMAGLKRSCLLDESMMFPIPFTQMLPAAGQGALAIQCRKHDARMFEILSSLNDAETADCVKMERELVLKLQGDCHSPIAAFAQIAGTTVTLKAAVAGRNGIPPLLHADAFADRKAGSKAVDAVYRTLQTQGVQALLGAGRSV